MTSIENVLQKGQRFWYDGRPATLVSKEYDYMDTHFSYHMEVTYKLRYDDEAGETGTLGKAAEWDLYRGMSYNPESGFKVGDTLEVKRDGLEPNLRGRLLEVDENAERWPYRVGEVGSNSVWFSWAELTKIHSVTSQERAPRAVEILKKTIAEKREELEALETALEVLEYATT